VAAGGFIVSMSLGVRSTFGLLVEPVIDTIGSGTGAFGIAVAVQNLMWGVSQPIAGAISDRFGAPRVLAGGLVLYALAMALMAQATSAGMLLLSGGFLIGIAIGAASFAVVLSSVGRMAPPEKRSMALGIVSAVGSLGQFAIIPFANWRLGQGTWQNTTLILAVLLIVAVAVTPMLRGSSAAGSAEPSSVADGVENVDSTEPVPRPLREDLQRARYARSYWLLNGGFFVCGFHVTFIGVYLKSYVQDLGQVGNEAAIALSLIGLFNVFGSLAAGWLGARYSNTHLLAGIYALRAVVIAVFVLMPASSMSTIIFGAAIGTLWLGTVPLTSAIVSKQFGTTNSGALFGIVFLSHQVGSFIGAWLGGTVADAMGSYTLMWWLAVALGLLAMGFHLLIDEGPVGDPPADRNVRLLPAAGMASLVLIGTSALAIAPTRTEAAQRADYDAVSDHGRVSAVTVDGSGSATNLDIWIPAYCHLEVRAPSDDVGTLLGP